MKVTDTSTLLSAVTSTGAGQSKPANGHRRTYHVSGTTSAGVGLAQVKVQVSNDGSTWVDLGVFNLTLSTSAEIQRMASNEAWKYHRGNVVSISGTNAQVTLVSAGEWK